MSELGNHIKLNFMHWQNPDIGYLIMMLCSDDSNSNILGNLVDAPFIQVLLLHFLWTIIILLDIYRLRLGFLLLRVWFWRKRRERKRNFKKYVWIPHLCHTILIQNGTRYPKLNKICNSAYLGARLLGMKYGYIYPKLNKIYHKSFL